MRMIVEAFKDTLELGLNKPGQVVVRIHLIGLNWQWRKQREPLFPHRI
jgi:hypothetical protein